MTTIAEQAPTTSVSVATPEVARKLRQECTAVRIQKSRWGLAKKLDAAQTDQLAQTFSADPKLLSSAKRLINPKNQTYRAPCSTLSEATGYWNELAESEAVVKLQREAIQAAVDEWNDARAELAKCRQNRPEDADAFAWQIVHAVAVIAGVIYKSHPKPEFRSCPRLPGGGWTPRRPAVRAGEARNP